MLQRETLGDQLYKVLRRRIVGGEIPAGKHIAQGELASEMGVSRIPVRDAFRRLEAEGLLVGDELGRFMVVDFGLDDAREVYAIRRRLEPLALELAMSRKDPALVEDLRSILREMQAGVQQGHADEYIELDRHFHFAIYEASRSPRLVKLIKGLWIGLPHLVPIKIPGRLERSLRQHEQLVELIAAGQVQDAVQVLDAHIGSACEELVKTYQAPQS